MGRERTFVVTQTNEPTQVPSDLAGLATVGYEWPRDDGSHQQAVGPACDMIRERIQALGISDRKKSQQLDDVQQRQKETESELRAIQIVVAALVPAEQFAHLESIANDPSYSPSVFDSVRKELRNLRGMGFLKSRPGKYIGAMPEGRVTLREWVELTPKGKEYLRLREEYAKE